MMDFWGKLAQKVRVPASTLVGVVFLLLMQPTVRSLWTGGAIAAAGALLRLWAAGHIHKGERLAQDGPYAWTRNPLYLGSLLMATGVLIGGGGYLLLLPFVLFYFLVYYPVMRAEERELLLGYGEEFVRYSQRVPFFFPGTPSNGESVTEFRWARVIENREHRNLLGLFAAELFLILRCFVNLS